MIEVVVIVSLLIFCLIREYFFYKEINKLTDKIISRDYTEYSQGILAIEKEKTKRANGNDPSPMVRI